MSDAGADAGAEERTDVVVAGAGPVGMAVAAFLNRAGIAVRVLERRPEPSGWSRGSAVHPRTLEVLDVLADRRGGTVADRLVAEGLTQPSAHFAALPSHLDYRVLEGRTRYPFLLMVAQTVTERVLAEHLDDAGVRIERGRPVTGLFQDDDGVRVLAGGGPPLRARYVVGADGGHGTVRDAAGIAFPGTPTRTVSFVADAYLDRPPERPHHWDEHRGTVSALPMPDGVYRVFGQDPADVGLDERAAAGRRDRPLDLESLRELMIRLCGDDFGLRGVIRAVRFGDASRHAERFRRGRVLVAGDAAHVHYPAGGQGLNAGVQDAANLSWKLAAEIAGWAPDRIVRGAQSYDAERRPIAERLITNTQAQTGLWLTFTPGGRALRELFTEMIDRDGDTADDLRGWMSGLGIGYPAPGSGPGEGEPAGRRVPDLPLSGGTRLHRTLRPDGLTFVALDGSVPLPAADARLTAVRADAGWLGAGAVLVRPDGYAAAAWSPEQARDAGAVAAVTASWTGGTRAAA